jgi:hypothetical protein
MMWYFRARMRSRRFLVVCSVVSVAVLGGTAAIAYAAYPNNSVVVMTGCLTTSGSGAGQLVNIAAASTPTKACGSNQKLVHLSGGTITEVTAGTGLTTNGSGGTDIGGDPNSINNGFATLGLQSSYALPQNCSSGQFPAWGGVSGIWGCGTDQNTTYSAGTGLDLSNSNAFSIHSTYQLPQNCSNGQIPDWGGTTWTCADDQNTTYSGKDFATSGQDCPTGQFATGIDTSGKLKCSAPATSTAPDAYFATDSHIIDAAGNTTPSEQDFVTLSGLPAGTYLVWGEVLNRRTGDFNDEYLYCDFKTGDGQLLQPAPDSFVVFSSSASTSTNSTTQTDEVSLPSNGELILSCGTSSPGNAEAFGTITALKVNPAN